MIYLDSALYTLLTGNADLVGLTGHTSGDPKIILQFPDQVASYPAIAFWEESTGNQLPDVDEIKSSQYNIGVMVGAANSTSYASWTTQGRLLCDRILDRLVQLFSPGSLASLDFSTSQVQTLGVVLQSKLPVRFEEEIDVYRGDITLRINWYLK